MSLNSTYNFKNSLPIDFENCGFAQREKVGEKLVIFRCGRDFLYYALHYYKSAKYNTKNFPPKKIEDEGILGMRLPWWLMWTTLQFNKLPSLLVEEQIELKINNTFITNYLSFFKAFIAPKKISTEEAIKVVEKAIDQHEVSGIDISLGLFGLVDHVIFVFAYDVDNFYVFDTQKLQKLEYEKITSRNDFRFIMKLPKDIVRKRWSRFGRVWVITPQKF